AGGFPPAPVSREGGGWTATGPAQTGRIQVAYGTVPVNFTGQFQIRAGIPASGNDRNGNPIPANSPIRNCAEVSATASTPRIACTDQTLVPLAVQFSKENV